MVLSALIDYDIINRFFATNTELKYIYCCNCYIMVL